MSGPEKEHIIGAYTFELGKVERVFIRERQVNEILANIDTSWPAAWPRTSACRHPLRRPWRRRYRPRRARRP